MLNNTENIKIPKIEFYVRHMQKYTQYSQNKNWIKWYANVAKYKGLRTIKILKQYKKNDAKVLDLGVGIGFTLSFLAQAFPNSIGCDVDNTAIKATEEILKVIKVSVPVVLYDGIKLPFADNSFDIVTAIEVVEHVDNRDFFLKEIKRVLKKDGILHITTANKWWPYEPHFKLLFLSYLPKKWADVYVRLLRRGDSYQNIGLPSYKSFRKMVGKYFKVKDITLQIIESYKDLEFDKERGKKVVLIGELLKFLNHHNNIKIVRSISIIIHWFLIRASLGWLFIAFPKKV